MKRKDTIVFIVLIVIILAGIILAVLNRNEANEIPERMNGETQEQVLSDAPADAEVYQINTEMSLVGWEGSKKIITTHIDRGTIDIQAGELFFEDEQLVGGNIVIDMNSISTQTVGNDMEPSRLDTHLKSDDFFNVAQYPTATLVVTDVSSSDEATYLITGDLTIRETTEQVSFPVILSKQGNDVFAEGQLIINRADFNVRFGSDSFFDNLGDNVINDEFRLNFRVVANAE